MSKVDNCILSFSILEEEEKRITEVNSFFGEKKGFVSVEDGRLPQGWYGGTKYLEAPLFIAAFNYFEEYEFMLHLRKVKWDQPNEVQLIIQRQRDDLFSIVTIQ